MIVHGRSRWLLFLLLFFFFLLLLLLVLVGKVMGNSVFLEFVIGIETSKTTSPCGELRRLKNQKRTKKKKTMNEKKKK